MQRILSKNRNYLVFVLAIVAIGILAGIIYFHFLDQDTLNNLLTTLNNYNVIKYNGILKYLTIMSLLLISSFFVIGILSFL